MNTPHCFFCGSEKDVTQFPLGTLTKGVCADCRNRQVFEYYFVTQPEPKTKPMIVTSDFCLTEEVIKGVSVIAFCLGLYFLLFGHVERPFGTKLDGSVIVGTGDQFAPTGEEGK